MQPIQTDVDAAQAAVDAFAGKTAYVHAECIPGGFCRNMRVDVRAGYVRGTGTYRVAFRCDGDAWVRMEGLTDWEIDGEGRLVFLAVGDAEQRLSRTLEVSLHPFDR